MGEAGGEMSGEVSEGEVLDCEGVSLNFPQFSGEWNVDVFQLVIGGVRGFGKGEVISPWVFSSATVAKRCGIGVVLARLMVLLTSSAEALVVRGPFPAVTEGAAIGGGLGRLKFVVLGRGSQCIWRIVWLERRGSMVKSGMW